GCHGRRRSSIPSPVKPLHRRPKLPSTARARHHRHHVEHGAPPPSTATNDAHEDVVADRPRPTTVGPSLPRSKSFITTATTSTFQIRRGRKPTLIIEATRGESSSPVINKFNSIPLRSMDQREGNTDRFLLKLHLAVESPKSLLLPFPNINEAWIGRSRPFIMQATIPIKACCRLSPPEVVAITARDNADARCRRSRRTRVRPSSLAHHRLHMLRCQHDATASLARCQLPAIQHVGKVGVGVSRPQRTTAMPTSHAATATVTAQLQCSIRITYK
ncbi:hypothetical protein ACLOJK_039470, partial [Asimina triloba]